MDYARPKKIFIVDDDPMLTEALSDYLKRSAAHQISTFDTGEACLKQLADKPEIIILDYHLNTRVKDAANGMEILQSIRKIDKNIHVIMLSSQERYAIAMQTIQKGAEQYVIKDETAFEQVAALVNAF